MGQPTVLKAQYSKESQPRGTETSKYPEERKSIETPLVVASERGPAEPGRVTGTVWKGRPQRVTAPYRKLHRPY